MLDACVLYPFTLRDVLPQSAAAGFYQVCWSETILDEALRNLVADGRMTEDKAAKRNDPKDRHVVAAAVKAGAQIIVTSNKRDFYDLPSGIEVQTPDEFLSNLFDLGSISNGRRARNARSTVQDSSDGGATHPGCTGVDRIRRACPARLA